MGKKRDKEHRKRVAKRNEQLKIQKKQAEKSAMSMLMKLIEQEKQKGAFESPIVPMPGFEPPTLYETNGPQL